MPVTELLDLLAEQVAAGYGDSEVLINGDTPVVDVFAYGDLESITEAVAIVGETVAGDHDVWDNDNEDEIGAYYFPDADPDEDDYADWNE